MVRDAYAELERLPRRQNSPRSATANCGYIWKALAIFKAKLTVWRLLRNCLPTKDNVSKRVALEDRALDCALCGKARESVAHVFLECEKGATIWGYLLSWIGVSWVAPNCVDKHISSFVDLCSGRRWRKRLGGFGFVLSGLCGGGEMMCCLHRNSGILEESWRRFNAVSTAGAPSPMRLRRI